MEVGITKDGAVGLLTYDSNTKEVFVDLPDKEAAEAVKDFLTTEREYQIPVQGDPSNIFAYDTVMKYPNESEEFIVYTLLVLHARTGVDVLWNTLIKET